MFSWQYKAGCVALWQKACLAYKGHSTRLHNTERILTVNRVQTKRQKIPSGFLHP